MKKLKQYAQLLIMHWQCNRPGTYRIEFDKDGAIKAIEAPSPAALDRLMHEHRHRLR